MNLLRNFYNLFLKSTRVSGSQIKAIWQLHPKSWAEHTDEWRGEAFQIITPKQQEV
ncbi:MAG: hypothetical protein HZB87_03420 [Desulfatitalea sp.]|nr:hypothetical protein [Desulfatitalea sp.]